MRSFHSLRHHSLACAAAAVASLAGCGGGGGSEAPAPAPTPPAPEMVAYTGKALDGALQGATACYDLNDNGVCDSGEPATATPSDANGNFTLSVPAAEAGKHRVVVEVSASTIDKDTGTAVGTAYTLVAPASGTTGAQAVVASPLSTLVQAHVDSTGVSVTEAASFIQTQAGLAQSPLADYSSASGAAATQAALVARLVQLTLNAQNSALASAVGTNDINGSVMTASDIARQSARAVIAALPAVATAVADPALASASGAALTTALQTAATATVAATGLDAATVAASVGVAKLPADTSALASGPSATLVALRWTDVNNWYYRSNEASAEDNVADANGMLRFYPVYRQSQGSGFSSSGTVTAWGLNSTVARSGDLHWNGSAWIGCPLFTRSLSAVRDSQGRASYQFCDGLESGQSQRSAMDLQGKSIASVFTDTIRKFPGGASGVNFADWGPANPAAVFGSATFPAGAKLFYYTQTPTRYAISYDVQTSNQVQAFSAAIAAGGDARADSSLACAAPNVTSSVISTLEQLVALNPGKPCIFNKGVSGSDSSLDPNEWWSNSTASLGILSGGATQPAGTGNWYSTDLRLRVAFAPTGNATTYYGCLSRATTGSSRNCSVIGSGTWAMQTLGDARVMTFTGLPAAAIKTGFNRVFVERGGKVYFGFQSVAGNTFSQVRLNLEATNAVFKPLGIGPIRPTARAADLKPADQAALTTIAGVWGEADDTTAYILRFTADGRYLHGQAGPADPVKRGQTGAEVGWFSYDSSTKKVSALTQVDADLTTGLSHPDDGETWTLAAEQFSGQSATDTFTATRLPAGSSPLHGLWALDSATELNTQHFAFFPNGKVLMIDPQGDTEPGACLTARQGPPGGEYASYTWDGASGALHVFDKMYDTNGCAGFFDSSAGAIANGTANTTADFTLTIATDGNTATLSGGDIGTPLTLYRIKTR